MRPDASAQPDVTHVLDAAPLQATRQLDAVLSGEPVPTSDTAAPAGPLAWAVPSPANAAAPVPAPDPAPSPAPALSPGSGPGPLPPAPDPLDRALSKRAGSGNPGSRRRALIGVAVVAALLLVGAGFVAGARFGGDDTARLVSGDRSGGASGDRAYGAQDGGTGTRPGEGFGPGGQGQGQGGDDGDGPFERPGRGVDVFAVAGRITTIGDSKLTLSTFQGSTVTVVTTSSTIVGGSTGGTLSSLSIGQTVYVAGSRNSDGSYQARAIMTGRVHGGDGDHGPDGDEGGADHRSS